MSRMFVTASLGYLSLYRVMDLLHTWFISTADWVTLIERFGEWGNTDVIPWYVLAVVW